MVETAMQKATEILQKAGVRMTPQRQVILENLYQRHHHPTVEELLRQIQENIPGFHSLSTATIYNNLKILKKYGLVKEIYTQTGTTRYDGNIDCHHHLHCTSCGKIIDSYYPLGLPISELQAAEGFSIHDVYVELRGLCPACKDGSRPSE